MIYSVTFSKPVIKILKKWKKSNPVVYKKAQDIIQDISEHPRAGLGHPEPLKGGADITYSRHITAHDRVIYDIYDDSIHVDVIEIEGHYNDK